MAQFFGFGSSQAGTNQPQQPQQGPQTVPGPTGAPQPGPGFQYAGGTFQDDIRMLIQTMGSSVVNTNAQLGSLANALHVQAAQQQQNQGYRALKPKRDLTKISADNARSLMIEIMQFEVDLGALGVNKNSEAAYRQLRAVVEGKARDVLDLEEVQGRGQYLKFQLDSYGQHGPQNQKMHCRRDNVYALHSGLRACSSVDTGEETPDL